MENNNITHVSKPFINACMLFAAFNAVLIVFRAVLDMSILGRASIIFVVIFAVVHGMKMYGWKRMLFFVAITFIISWAYETSSILTGFPFGYYHYTDYLGPKIGLVPILIMPAYISMGYLSWVIALVLLDKKDSAVKGAELILVPLFASFVMVAWDMCMDPVNSTIRQGWIWHEGGPYFGVPFVNFMGWFLCVFTFYFLFAFSLKAKNNGGPSFEIQSKAYWILPVLVYLTRSMEFLINAAVKDNVEVASRDGHIWWTGDIYGALALVTIFTMVFMSFNAIVRAAR